METEPGYRIRRKLPGEPPEACWMAMGFMQDEHAACSAARRYAATSGHHTSVISERDAIVYDSERDGTEETIEPAANQGVTCARRPACHPV